MDINILLALGAGIVSFFSPCVLPLYPSYLSYITGISVDKLMNDFNKREIRNRALIHTLFFIFGLLFNYICCNGFCSNFNWRGFLSISRYFKTNWWIADDLNGTNGNWLVKDILVYEGEKI